MVVSMWKIFEKAGMEGWECIIPIYSTYILTKIVNKPGYWTILMLIPYNYPQTPFSEDDRLDIFKEREIVVDGYSIIVNYQQSDYNTYLLKTLQIYNRVGYLLPFNFIVKVVKKFLGADHLVLVEITKEDVQIYCWSLACDYENKAIKMPYCEDCDDCDERIFEGTHYMHINASNVFFY